MKEIEGQFFSLVPKDFIKGAILAGLGSVLAFGNEVVNSGALPTNPATYEHVAVIAGKVMIAYLIKNLLTNSEDKFLRPEPKAAAVK